MGVVTLFCSPQTVTTAALAVSNADDGSKFSPLVAVDELSENISLAILTRYTVCYYIN